MTTAVDTNILFDILLPDEEFLASSREALIEARERGRVVVSETVYAEVAGEFTTVSGLDEFLTATSISLERSSAEALHATGAAWRRFGRGSRRFTCPRCGAVQEVRCEQCGQILTRRQHVLADFLVGAHALVHAGRLLTRDRGYYRTYFPDLVLV